MIYLITKGKVELFLNRKGEEKQIIKTLKVIIFFLSYLFYSVLDFKIRRETILEKLHFLLVNLEFSMRKVKTSLHYFQSKGHLSYLFYQGMSKILYIILFTNKEYSI